MNIGSGGKNSTLDCKKLGDNLFEEEKHQAAVDAYTRASTERGNKQDAVDLARLYADRSAALLRCQALSGGGVDVDLGAEGDSQPALGRLTEASDSFQKGSLTAGAGDEALSTWTGQISQSVPAVEGVHLPLQHTLTGNEPLVPEPSTSAPDGVEDDLQRKVNASARMLSWLKAGGAEFPQLYLSRHGEDNRAVHASSDIEPRKVILSIPRKFLITVEMGKATAVGAKDPKGSFFKPYHDLLPKQFRNIPLYWTEEELGWLGGSCMADHIQERVESIEEDYKSVCRAAPEFCAPLGNGGLWRQPLGGGDGGGGFGVTLEDFKRARVAVASRNFGVVMGDGNVTDALVPLADMLNHQRPRHTKWTFDKGRDAFTVTTLSTIAQGCEVFDSYGKKGNSRYLLNYGFTVEDNSDPGSGGCHNEAWVWMDLDRGDPHLEEKVQLLGLEEGESTGETYCISDDLHHGSTQEALSMARFICTEGPEIPLLPPVDVEVDLRKSPVPPLTCENEARVLRLLAERSKAQLAGYPTTLEEDRQALARNRVGSQSEGSETQSKGMEPQSNRWNATVLVAGEKEVLHHYKRLAGVVVPLLDLGWPELRRVVMDRFKGWDPVSNYVKTVVVPLVQKRWAKRSLDSSAP